MSQKTSIIDQPTQSSTWTETDEDYHQRNVEEILTSLQWEFDFFENEVELVKLRYDLAPSEWGESDLERLQAFEHDCEAIQGKISEEREVLYTLKENAKQWLEENRTVFVDGSGWRWIWTTEDQRRAEEELHYFQTQLRNFQEYVSFQKVHSWPALSIAEDEHDCEVLRDRIAAQEKFLKALNDHKTRSQEEFIPAPSFYKGRRTWDGIKEVTEKRDHDKLQIPALEEEELEALIETHTSSNNASQGIKIWSVECAKNRQCGIERCLELQHYSLMMHEQTYIDLVAKARQLDRGKKETQENIDIHSKMMEYEQLRENLESQIDLHNGLLRILKKEVEGPMKDFVLRRLEKTSEDRADQVDDEQRNPEESAQLSSYFVTVNGDNQANKLKWKEDSMSELFSDHIGEPHTDSLEELKDCDLYHNYYVQFQSYRMGFWGEKDKASWAEHCRNQGFILRNESVQVIHSTKEDHSTGDWPSITERKPTEDARSTAFDSFDDFTSEKCTSKNSLRLLEEKREDSDAAVLDIIRRMEEGLLLSRDREDDSDQKLTAVRTKQANHDKRIEGAEQEKMQG